MAIIEKRTYFGDTIPKTPDQIALGRAGGAGYRVDLMPKMSRPLTSALTRVTTVCCLFAAAAGVESAAAESNAHFPAASASRFVEEHSPDDIETAVIKRVTGEDPLNKENEFEFGRFGVGVAKLGIHRDGWLGVAVFISLREIEVDLG